jgi:hypothetical protein
MLNSLTIAFICLGLLASDTCIQSVSSQKQIKQTPVARAKLRGFGVDFNLLDVYEMRQKLKKLLLKHELERKNKEISDENAKRRRIYEKYLLEYQGGSNFLRDFHTNRF